MSYACTYGTSIEKIELIKNKIGGFLFNQRDPFGRTSLQSLVLNRNICLKERLLYISKEVTQMKIEDIKNHVNHYSNDGHTFLTTFIAEFALLKGESEVS